MLYAEIKSLTFLTVRLPTGSKGKRTDGRDSVTLESFYSSSASSSWCPYVSACVQCAFRFGNCVPAVSNSAAVVRNSAAAPARTAHPKPVVLQPKISVCTTHRPADECVEIQLLFIPETVFKIKPVHSVCYYVSYESVRIE